jgi:hypothetical protein
VLVLPPCFVRRERRLLLWDFSAFFQSKTPIGVMNSTPSRDRVMSAASHLYVTEETAGDSATAVHCATAFPSIGQSLFEAAKNGPELAHCDVEGSRTKYFLDRF